MGGKIKKEGVYNIYIYICQKCSYTYRFDINLKNQPYIYVYIYVQTLSTCPCTISASYKQQKRNSTCVEVNSSTPQHDFP